MRVDTTKTSTQGTSSGVSGGDSPRSPKASDKQPRSDGETKGAQYHCDYCRKDITSVVSIKCAECRDFDLCLECFAEGVEVYPHRNNHPYRVIDHITTPIFDDEWGADEELLLLEAIELYGLGNWSDVADHVGRTKTKAKCEAHYYEIFLNSRTAPLPDLNRPLVTRKTKKEEDAAAAAAEKEREEEEAKAKAARPKTGDLGHLVGYIPNRGDFETEYDNDAELILADMEFKEEDTKRERDLKLKIIEIYNSKLDARIERKRFILERGLLHSKEKKRTKEEREVYNNMRVFARFHTKEQHEEFVQGLINEQRLRKRIEQLQNQRLNGVRTLADGELFEAERKRREEGDRKRTELAADTNKGKGKRSVSTVESDSRAKARKTEGADAPSSTAATAAAASASSSSNAAAAAAAALPPLDLTGLEGTELLSNDEKKLCSELRLLPQHYFVVKERLIREAFLRGILKPGQARQLFKIDVNKTNKIFDFFVTVGWINTQHSAQAAAAAAAAAAPVAAGAGAGSSAYGYGRPPVLDDGDDAPAAASAALAAAVKAQPR